MRFQEKKYRVDSFKRIEIVLGKLGTQKGKETTTTHYYVPQETNDVVKLVRYEDRNEIHRLREEDGKFLLAERVPLKDIEEGFRWLKNWGCRKVEVVRMVNTDYEYKSGIIGLYLVDNFLYSVILDFPNGQQEAIEKELGLDKAEVISMPYNKFLRQLGTLRSLTINRQSGNSM